jgi:hypothetical protein
MNRVVFDRMVLFFGASLLAVAIDIVVTSAPLALHTMILRGQFRPSLDFLDGQLAAALNQPIEDFHVDDAGRIERRRMEPLK